MRIAVVGVGATGARAARQLASTDAVDTVVVADADADQRRKVADLLGSRAEAADVEVPEADVVLVASPAGTQAALATTALRTLNEQVLYSRIDAGALRAGGGRAASVHRWRCASSRRPVANPCRCSATQARIAPKNASSPMADRTAVRNSVPW